MKRIVKESLPSNETYTSPIIDVIDNALYPLEAFLALMQHREDNDDLVRAVSVAETLLERARDDMEKLTVFIDSEIGRVRVVEAMAHNSLNLHAGTWLKVDVENLVM